MAFYINHPRVLDSRPAGRPAGLGGRPAGRLACRLGGLPAPAGQLSKTPGWYIWVLRLLEQQNRTGHICICIYIYIYLYIHIHVIPKAAPRARHSAWEFIRYFPKTNDAGGGGVLTWLLYRITFVHQDLPSPPGYLGYLRIPEPSCQ